MQSIHQISAITSTLFGITILSLMTLGGLALLKNYTQVSDNQEFIALSKDYLFIVSSMITLCMSLIKIGCIKWMWQIQRLLKCEFMN